MPTDNIALAVLERAAQQPDAPAFVVPGRMITYQRTAALVLNFARHLQAAGVSRQSLVGIDVQSVATATIATLAVAMLGGRWAFPTKNIRGFTHMLVAEAGTLSSGRRINIDKTWYHAPPVPKGGLSFAGHANARDAWMTAVSSGTTGNSKLIPISYAAVWRRVGLPDGQDGAPPILWDLFPPLGAHGARVNVGNLVAGGTNVSPERWPDVLELGVNRVTGSPSQVASLIFDRVPPPNRRIRSVKVAGSQVTRQFVETALRYFEEIHLAYGATEVGAVAHALVTDIGQFDGSVGQPNEGAAFEIVDKDDRPLPRDSEGIVRVRTEWMVSGYVDDPELTASTFRDGWFYPGDLGFIDAGGSLHIAGRTNDVINIGGVKLHAVDLDEVIQQHPDVAEGFCFLGTSTNGASVLSVIVALRPGADADRLGALGQLAKEKLGRFKVPRVAYVADRVPRNENGKPLRAEAAALAAQLTPIEIPS